MSQLKGRKFRRILLIKPSSLGDCLHAVPVLNGLRAAMPEAKISWLINSEYAQIIEGHPALDEVIRFDKRGRDRGLRGLLRLLRRIRDRRFDAGLAAQRAHRTAILLRFGRVPLRIGFESAPGDWAYTDAVPWNGERPAVRRYLDLAGPAGGDPPGADRPQLA